MDEEDEEEEEAEEGYEDMVEDTVYRDEGGPSARDIEGKMRLQGMLTWVVANIWRLP